MEYKRLLLKVSVESAYLKYIPMRIVIRSVPGENIEFYAKISGHSEKMIPDNLELMKNALKECIEITKEEYDQF